MFDGVEGRRNRDNIISLGVSGAFSSCLFITLFVWLIIQYTSGGSTSAADADAKKEATDQTDD